MPPSKKNILHPSSLPNNNILIVNNLGSDYRDKATISKIQFSKAFFHYCLANVNSYNVIEV